MFQRFSESARRSVVLAQDEARALQHDYIGTEHLLLGLLHTGKGLAVDVLTSRGVVLEDARSQVVEMVGRGEADQGAYLQFTEHAKKVLELSLRECMQLGHQEITGGHILLALLRESEGVAARGLKHLGVDLAALRAAILAALAGHDPGPERGRAQRPAPGGPAADARPSPLERLDDSAWDAVNAARNAARQRDATAIGMIDLLSGIATVAGPGADVLRAVGVDIDALHAAIHATSGTRTDAPPALPFTAAARSALTWAKQEAAVRGHLAATTAHILLALMTDVDSELAEVADGLGIRTSDMQDAALRHIDAL